MRKKLLSIFAVALILAAVLLAAGCNGKLNMVTGCWKQSSIGDEDGNNQQDGSGGLPFTMYYDIHPDGRVCLLFGGEESPFGKYTMDRDTFTFTSDDGETKHSGQFSVDMGATDSETGESIVKMTIVLDDQPMSIVLQKMMDYSGLVAYLKSQTATPAPAAPAATGTPAPTASAQ